MEKTKTPTKSMHLYLQIIEDMRRKIVNGVYKVDELLPSEKELCSMYKASRVTIRKALQVLEDEGLITRKAGFGTTINYNHAELKNFTSVKSFTSEMKEKGDKTVTFSSTISIVFADAHLMKIFNCGFSEKLYNLKRVRGSNNKPIVYSDTWLRLPIELPTTQEFLFGSLYKYLISKDILFARFDESIEAMLGSRELKKILELDEDSAVLKRVRYGYGLKNELIEYTVNYYDANLYKYNIEIDGIDK